MRMHKVTNSGTDPVLARRLYGNTVEIAAGAEVEIELDGPITFEGQGHVRLGVAPVGTRRQFQAAGRVNTRSTA